MSSQIDTLFNAGGPSGLGYSEVESYLVCPKSYQLAKVRGIGKPVTQTPDYFAVGSFLHAGRARWFAQKFDMGDETWKMIVADIDKVRSEFTLPVSETAYMTALRYVKEYVDHWAVRPRPNIVAVEHMLGPVQLDGEKTERTARLDDFGFYPEAGNALCIGECKTTSAAISDVANQYTLHGQPALQRLLWELAPQGEATYGAVKGMILDVVQKGYGGKRCQFARLFVEVPDRVTGWVGENLAAALRAKDNMTWDTKAERRVTSCTRLIGKARVACPYRDLCLYGRAGALGYAFEDGSSITEWEPSAGAETAPWD